MPKDKRKTKSAKKNYCSEARRADQTGYELSFLKNLSTPELRDLAKDQGVFDAGLMGRSALLNRLSGRLIRAYLYAPFGAVWGILVGTIKVISWPVRLLLKQSKSPTARRISESSARGREAADMPAGGRGEIIVFMSSPRPASSLATGKWVDLRSDVQRSNAKRAHSHLEPADEKIAQELAQLSSSLGEQDRTIGGVVIGVGGKSSDPRCKRMREIGKFLCSHGGSDRMDLICSRVAVLCGTTTWCRLNWEGVCGWDV